MLLALGVKHRANDIHRLLAAYNLDRYLLTSLAGLAIEDASFYNVGKHAFAEMRKYLIAAAIELFTQDDLVVTLWIGSRIQRRRDQGRSR